ncbi:autoinducer binding domain-containing protein [Oceanicoccus sp. KOV_DT_Chl]|uniref:helix-turn-helix transcriptional regulator n=1 Tax=Oceanicoccus sp. KOV_DT_Chl TaxID=1904639 RepID=UPI00135AF2A6|nr:autoinducer binding domain-containing protein [Oceanicoccus sp. KOV_DT_Chl]
MKSQFIDLIVEDIAPGGCTRGANDPECINRLQQTIERAAASLGFRYYRFAFRLKGMAINSMISPGFYLSNFPVAWDSRYIAERHYLFDPVIRFTSDSDSPEYIDHGYWSELIDKALAKPINVDNLGEKEYLQRAMNVYSEAAQHGIYSGIFLQIANDIYISDLSFATPENTSNKVDWREVRAGALLLGDIINSLYDCESCKDAGQNPADIKSPSLSKAEAEVLRLFFENPSAGQKQIAELKSCTVDNIKVHLKNIRKKFNLPKVSGHQLARLARNQHFL